MYDSTGNSVSYNIKGVSKVEKNDGVVTVTVVAPKNVGVRRLELYDSDKNIIMEKNVEYKNRNEMKFDFVTDKDVYQIKLYGYDGSTTVWKPEITYIKNKMIIEKRIFL